MQKISLNNKEDGVLSRYQKGSGTLKSLIESGFVVVVSEQYFKSNYNCTRTNPVILLKFMGIFLFY